MSGSAEYDFVIVGGGTAGLVLANRLTENESVSVVVLEAGSNHIKDARITVPGLSSALYDDPEFDWSFKSVPQVGCLPKSARRSQSSLQRRKTSMEKSSLTLAARPSAAPAPSTSLV